MPIRIVAEHPKRQARRGQFRTPKKSVPNVAKSAQHPHSKLKTQKELKKITDSSSYKKADYKGKTEMLGGKVKTGFRQQRQKEYIKKHGKPDKKRIQIRPKVSDRMQKLRDNLASVTGGEWGKKSGGRIGLKEGGGGTYGGWPKGGPSKPPKIPQDIRDKLKDLGRRKFGKPKWGPDGPSGGDKVSPGRPGGKGKKSPDKRWNKGDKFMTPLRAKKGVGGILKKIITKIKPKPKGGFKPKPVPKGVTDRPAGWSPKGSYTKSDDKKITSMLKNLGDEIKAAPLPPQLKKTLKKAQKAFPHKKAAGGRIGLQHGNRPRPQGPHTWVRKKPKGVKIAIKGW